MLKNLCLPSGGCSHRCYQGQDCIGSRDHSRRLLRLPPLTAEDLAAGQRALHIEDGGTWLTAGHRVLRLRPEAAATPAPKPSRWPAIVGGAIGLLLACAAAAAVAGFGFNPFL